MPSRHGWQGQKQFLVLPLLVNKVAIDPKQGELTAGGPAIKCEVDLATGGFQVLRHRPFRPVVDGRVRDVHAGQLADRGLVLEDRLQHALAQLGLVGRVRGQQLAALEAKVEDLRQHLLVTPTADAEEQVSVEIPSNSQVLRVTYRSEDPDEAGVGAQDRGGGERLDPGRRERAFKERIGSVLQETGVEPYRTVRETLELFGGYYPHPRDVDHRLEATAHIRGPQRIGPAIVRHWSTVLNGMQVDPDEHHARASFGPGTHRAPGA
jgi:hypothetical protein